MNFLEAFKELDELNEASNQYQIPYELKYRQVQGDCPGCGKHFEKAEEYEQHITGFYRKNANGKFEWIDGCEDALKAIENTNMPGRIKVGKKDHSYDEMTNITAADLIRYKAKCKACEICGARELQDTELVYDHEHSKDGSHSGAFRGILCKSCNTLLGQLERDIAKQNSLPYEEYLANIARYLKRAQKWKASGKFKEPDLYYKYNK